MGGIRIVFSDKDLNSREIKDSHICFSRTISQTDRFRNVKKIVKHRLQNIKDILLKTSDFGSIWNFGKATKFPQWFGVMQKSKRWSIEIEKMR